MTDEELRVRAIQELEFYKKDDTFMLADITVDLAIKALKQMPVTTTTGEEGVIYYPQVEGVTPTVVNPIKTGHWIKMLLTDMSDIAGQCSECGFIHKFVGGHTAQYNYCPNCGCRMVEPQESEDKE